MEKVSFREILFLLKMSRDLQMLFAAITHPVEGLCLETILTLIVEKSLSKGCHLDGVRGPSTPHDPESDSGGSLSSWQGHPSR
jgi:hypothetical protein